MLINHQTSPCVTSLSIIRNLKSDISMNSEPDMQSTKCGKKSDTSMLIQNHFMMKTEVVNKNKEHKNHLDKKKCKFRRKIDLLQFCFSKNPP